MIFISQFIRCTKYLFTLSNTSWPSDFESTCTWITMESGKTTRQAIVKTSATFRFVSSSKNEYILLQTSTDQLKIWCYCDFLCKTPRCVHPSLAKNKDCVFCTLKNKALALLSTRVLGRVYCPRELHHWYPILNEMPIN